MKIMGILNVTPDSFSDGGRYVDVEVAVAHGKQMVADGAKMIDVGGESTRPGAKCVSEEEELARVIPVIKGLKAEIDVPISIDTYKAKVAQLAVLAGASVINDVWGGTRDADMLHVVASLGTQVVLMHNRTLEKETKCVEGIVEAVCFELQHLIDLALLAGVESNKIILDPGIGFGKTLEQNIRLIKEISVLKTLGYPVLLAASKKRTIRGLAKTDDTTLLGIGTVATTCHAFAQGIDYVRVHDVRENKAAIDVMAGLRD